MYAIIALMLTFIFGAVAGHFFENDNLPVFSMFSVFSASSFLYYFVSLTP